MLYNMILVTAPCFERSPRVTREVRYVSTLQVVPVSLGTLSILTILGRSKVYINFSQLLSTSCFDTYHVSILIQ